MSLIPINHPMRPVFRTLGGLAGLFLFVTGVLGLVRSWGGGVFARDSVWVFGLRFNPASAAVFLLLGALVVIATVIGGQVEHFTNLIAGVAVLGIGFMALALLRFANFLNYSMTNVIVSFILGLLLVTVGMYDKVGPTAAEVHARRRSSHTARS
ncbi:MAG: DUF4383 domain-containing protein [Actinobacteria bacterium]|nr:MAG: DUF4383 domain-containing protein [Actinomycetota bacterium]